MWAWGWSWGVHSFLQKDPKWGQFAIIDVLYPMESYYMESYLGVKITPKFDRPVGRTTGTGTTILVLYLHKYHMSG